MEEVRKDSENSKEVDEGLGEEIEALLKEEEADTVEDTSSKKQVEDADTSSTMQDEGVDYGTDIPTKDVKKYGFD